MTNEPPKNAHLRKHVVHDGLAGGAHHQRLLQVLAAAWGQWQQQQE